MLGNIKYLFNYGKLELRILRFNCNKFRMTLRYKLYVLISIHPLYQSKNNVLIYRSKKEKTNSYLRYLVSLNKSLSQSSLRMMKGLKMKILAERCANDFSLPCRIELGHSDFVWLGKLTAYFPLFGLLTPHSNEVANKFVYFLVGSNTQETLYKLGNEELNKQTNYCACSLLVNTNKLLTILLMIRIIQLKRKEGFFVHKLTVLVILVCDDRNSLDMDHVHCFIRNEKMQDLMVSVTDSMILSLTSAYILLELED
ncbi:hypothetical protein EGR_09699 [Echinococcus granulosus]|uniref:Uncharacterized protein n=1 Tax=Echinococcus granulosus TaxID=6210 RepID=W6UQ17_ECHGR|nr:hypothetical protein EGR_09699 [Echinococcus granulosus]EUB55454.1 hypothetical protein EGR_09699 [Echinococcus granulosus]